MIRKQGCSRLRISTGFITRILTRNSPIFHQRDFIKNILVDGLNMKLAVVGFNYRFGYMGKGDPEFLKRLGDKYGFKVIVVPLVR